MIKVAIFGLGNRGRMYADYAKQEPSKMQVVQIVDTNKTALDWARENYGVKPENCYSSVEEFLKAPKIADAVLNCTMDQYHYDTTMPLFKLGYHVLLEKPISVSEKELNELRDESKKYKRAFMVCHVLRYAPFYRKVKEILLSGEVGKLVSIEMAEHVYVPHMLASYVRGKWRSESECGSPMIMAKCCHDTDLMCWFNEGHRPTFISSFGERSVFVPENKPEGASDRCMTCKHKETCQYSCYFNLELKHMDPIIFQNAFPGKNWDELTKEDKIKVFTESPSLGLCAFSGPQDLVDHQVTSVAFENGVTATLNMIGGTSYPCRTLHITCTGGEIYGVLEENKVFERIYQKDKFWRETICHDLGNVGDGHGGGDVRLIADFVHYLETGELSISQTNIDSSIDGHLVAIAADKSDKNHKVIVFGEDRSLKQS
ncbi:MAG: Gfo/Idh/MocA family oxidoreductase [Bacilli bacterium]|nr:Gfo/Idh/MocA family oxidoreductase [Bacilli bacterium]